MGTDPGDSAAGTPFVVGPACQRGCCLWALSRQSPVAIQSCLAVSAPGTLGGKPDPLSVISRGGLFRRRPFALPQIAVHFHGLVLVPGHDGSRARRGSSRIAIHGRSVYVLAFYW